jgi:tetratricopeptide (TPR) repeat protein
MHSGQMRITDPGEKPRGTLPAATLAALITFLVFLPATKNGFVELDDLDYIVNNPHIGSLDWRTVVWAFTRFHEANWHPLTMLSLALDRRLWGLDPFGFHLTSIVIHSCTVFLACFLFASLLKAAFRAGSADAAGMPNRRLVAGGSFAGALFFGLHPLRVESVAWASERKDVLCTFFAVAALWWYLRYVHQRSLRPRKGFPGFGSYWMTLLAACLALLSKPAAVSLPFVLLLLDWYPLDRIKSEGGFSQIIGEKIPLASLAAGTALLTLIAQQGPIALSSDLTAWSRLLVACKAVLFYLGKIAWPSALAPYYPHPGNVDGAVLAEYLFYAVGVAATSLAAGLLAGRQRMWAAVWAYFLVTLGPSLGIIQAGSQWAADRYTYLPALGISLLWGGGGAWLVHRLRQKGHTVPALLLAGAAVCQIASYTAVTLRIIPHWRDTGTIATREIELVPHEAGAAYYARAKYLDRAGEYRRALEDIDEALAIARRKGVRSAYSELSMTRAGILSKIGRKPEALDAVNRAIRESGAEPPPAVVEFRNELMQEMARREKASR